MKKTIEEKLYKLLRIIIPFVLIWAGIIYFVFKTFFELLKKGDFSSIMIPYFTIIAIEITLSSTTFAYARTKKLDGDKEDVTHIGELFLYSAVSAIIAFITTWVIFQLSNPVKGIFHNLLYLFLSFILFPIGELFFIRSGIGFYKGLTKLGTHLFQKVGKEMP